MPCICFRKRDLEPKSPVIATRSVTVNKRQVCTALDQCGSNFLRDCTNEVKRSSLKNRFDSGTHRNVVEGIKVCQRASYMMIREKVTAREGQTPKRHVVKELAYCLSVVVVVFVVSLTEAKDHRPGP
jgi:hypothetical protein